MLILPSMDSQDLRLFLAVAEQGSFSAAAESVHLTQPAVSKRIARLESQLDARLFDRFARTVQLTEAGRLLLPRAREILREFENLSQGIRSLQGSVAGTLSIAISHHLGLHRLPVYLQRFSEEYPAVELDVTFTDSEKAYEGVLQGRYELAAITLAPQEHPRIAATAIWDDRLRFVCGRRHALAHAEMGSLQTLSAHPCLLPALNTYTGRIVKTLFDRERLMLRPILQTNYLETLARMTEIGLGWSVLPETLIDEYDLVPVPVPLHLRRQLGVIHHRERSLSMAGKAFHVLLTGSTISSIAAR